MLCRGELANVRSVDESQSSRLYLSGLSEPAAGPYCRVLGHTVGHSWLPGITPTQLSDWRAITPGVKWSFRATKHNGRNVGNANDVADVTDVIDVVQRAWSGYICCGLTDKTDATTDETSDRVFDTLSLIINIKLLVYEIVNCDFFIRSRPLEFVLLRGI